MNIAIGSDHAGFKLKNRIKTLLESMNYRVLDVGTQSEESCDYPDFAEKVARAVTEGKSDIGVLFCGTGIGMAMAANKVPGIRAAVCHNEYTTEMSRKHNHANVFCAGARVLDEATVEKLLKLWLSTPPESGRHERRIQKIAELDRLHK